MDSRGYATGDKDYTQKPDLQARTICLANTLFENKRMIIRGATFFFIHFAGYYAPEREVWVLADHIKQSLYEP